MGKSLPVMYIQFVYSSKENFRAAFAATITSFRIHWIFTHFWIRLSSCLLHLELNHCFPYTTYRSKWILGFSWMCNSRITVRITAVWFGSAKLYLPSYFNFTGCSYATLTFRQSLDGRRNAECMTRVETPTRRSSSNALIPQITASNGSLLRKGLEVSLARQHTQRNRPVIRPRRSTQPL